MAATSTYMASTSFPMLSWTRRNTDKIQLRKRNTFSVSAQQSEAQQQDVNDTEMETKEEVESDSVKQKQVKGARARTPLRPVEKQINVKSKNMEREYGGQWLSSTTRHVRLYAAYIDPDTLEFDQTQLDKLTLILDPSDEFVWTDDTCNDVYSYFQELVDHYEGAPLNEYTLRLIGSDIEHYIRKMLYQGDIKYNMEARVLNFSMGKPRVGFTYDGQPPDAQ